MNVYLCAYVWGSTLVWVDVCTRVCVWVCMCVWEGGGWCRLGRRGWWACCARIKCRRCGADCIGNKNKHAIAFIPTHTHTRALNAFLTKLHSTLSTHTHIHTRFVHKKNASLERGTVDGIVRPLEPAASCFPAPNTTRHSLFLRRPLTINPTFHCPSEMIPPPLFTYVPGTFFAATKHATKSRDSKTLKTTEKRQKFNLQYGKNL